MIKKIIRQSIFLIAAINCVFLGGCANSDSTQPSTNNSSAIESEAVITEAEVSLEEIEQMDEERFLELFTECYNKYEQEGLGVELNYRELAEIYHKYPDNEMMKNLFLFCSTCANYRNYVISELESQLEFAKEQAAKINPNYDGPYAKEVLNLAIILLGDEYENRAAIVLEQINNYEELSFQDKMDIVERLLKNNASASDDLWQQVAKEYGISENHVFNIYTDIEVLKAVGQENVSEQEITEYDAYLEYGSGSVLICNSKDSMKRFVEALTMEDNDTIEEMEKNGEVSYTTKGTKCNIIERELTSYKVKILDGLYKDNMVWVIAESVKNK